MCNHNPITPHEHGGQTVICALCGRILKPWQARGESGQCLAVCLLTLGGAMLAFFVWFCLFIWTGSRVLADIGGTMVFLGIFFFAMKLCDSGSQRGCQ